MDFQRELCGMRSEEQMQLVKALVRARAALDAGEPAEFFIAQADAASRRWTALGDALRALRRLESR